MSGADACSRADHAWGPTIWSYVQTKPMPVSITDGVPETEECVKAVGKRICARRCGAYVIHDRLGKVLEEGTE